MGGPLLPSLGHRAFGASHPSGTGDAGFRSPLHDPTRTSWDGTVPTCQSRLSSAGQRQRIRGHLFPAAFRPAKGCDPSTII